MWDIKMSRLKMRLRKVFESNFLYRIERTANFCIKYSSPLLKNKNVTNEKLKTFLREKH